MSFRLFMAIALPFQVLAYYSRAWLKFMLENLYIYTIKIHARIFVYIYYWRIFKWVIGCWMVGGNPAIGVVSVCNSVAIFNSGNRWISILLVVNSWFLKQSRIMVGNFRGQRRCGNQPDRRNLMTTAIDRVFTALWGNSHTKKVLALLPISIGCNMYLETLYRTINSRNFGIQVKLLFFVYEQCFQSFHPVTAAFNA